MELTRSVVQYSFKAVATTLVVAMLFIACGEPYKPSELTASEKALPQGVVENLELSYTESVRPLSILQSDTTRVVAVLRANRNENFENRAFPYQFFPDGFHLTFYDEQQLPTDIYADTAYYYSSTGLVYLIGNVRILTHDQKKLTTKQLYWSQSRNWVFTEHPFEFINPTEGTIMNGEGMEFSRDFTTFQAMKTRGIYELSESDN